MAVYWNFEMNYNQEGHKFTSFCNYSVLPSLKKVYYYYYYDDDDDMSYSINKQLMATSAWSSIKPIVQRLNTKGTNINTFSQKQIQ